MGELDDNYEGSWVGLAGTLVVLAVASEGKDGGWEAGKGEGGLVL